MSEIQAESQEISHEYYINDIELYQEWIPPVKTSIKVNWENKEILIKSELENNISGLTFSKFKLISNEDEYDPEKTYDDDHRDIKSFEVGEDILKEKTLQNTEQYFNLFPNWEQIYNQLSNAKITNILFIKFTENKVEIKLQENSREQIIFKQTNKQTTIEN